MKTLTIILLLTLGGCSTMKTPEFYERDGNNVVMRFDYSLNELPYYSSEFALADASKKCKTGRARLIDESRSCGQEWQRSNGCDIYRVTLTYSCD